MRKIKAAEFHELVNTNPNVFEQWNTPLEITEYIICSENPITHLSPFLTFSGKDGDGDVANFRACPNLKIATGTFHGFVNFNYSGVEKIKNLQITKTTLGWVASFMGCKSLQTATGNYIGFLTFQESGIHTIQNLHIESPDENGNYADFTDCPNLQTLESWDLTKQIVIEPEKLAAEKRRRASLQKFIQTTQPHALPFLCRKSQPRNFWTCSQKTRRFSNTGKPHSKS
jgi:hypothetical protein